MASRISVLAAFDADLFSRRAGVRLGFGSRHVWNDGAIEISEGNTRGANRPRVFVAGQLTLGGLYLVFTIDGAEPGTP